MILSIRKQSNTELLLLLLLIGCWILGLFNYFIASLTINYTLYVLNYIIVFSIICFELIHKDGSNFLIVSFYFCFLVFLMGQKPFEEHYNIFLTFTRTELDNSQYSKFVFILQTGIVFLYLGYKFSVFKPAENVFFISESYLKSIRIVARVLFWITLPAAVYMQVHVVFVRSSLSYTDGYLINVYVPTIVKIGYYLFTTFTLILLATKPQKGELWFVLIVFIVFEGGIQLMQGRRAFFATSLLFIIWYLMKYRRRIRISRKMVIRFAALAFALVVLFFIIEVYRDGDSFSSQSISYIVSSFLISTGGSDSVIANTIMRYDAFPKPGVLYLIDPIIHNPIVNILTGKNGINQGPDYLSSFNSFPHWISYLTEPSLYYSGHGMGSSYLAELYLAFGIAGVLVVSIFLGIIIRKLDNMSFTNNVFRNVIIFVLIRSLFTMPRSGLFSWFGEFIYSCLGIIVVFLISNPLYAHRNGNRSNANKIKNWLTN